MNEEQYDAHVRAWHEYNARFRTEDEILADPAIDPAIRLRIVADILGRALFRGMARHHERVGLTDEPPPAWDDLSFWERDELWRPAIYDMMDEVNERFVRTGIFPRKPQQ